MNLQDPVQLFLVSESGLIQNFEKLGKDAKKKKKNYFKTWIHFKLQGIQSWRSRYCCLSTVCSIMTDVIYHENSDSFSLGSLECLKD